MPRNPDLSLVVQGAMTDDERRLFLERFTQLNPRWKGAHVADVLSVLFDHEEHLEMIEQVQKDAKEDLRWEPGVDKNEVTQHELFDLCVLAVLYAYGPEVTRWELVKPLLLKCKQEAAA